MRASASNGSWVMCSFRLPTGGRVGGRLWRSARSRPRSGRSGRCSRRGSSCTPGCELPKDSRRRRLPGAGWSTMSRPAVAGSIRQRSPFCCDRRHRTSLPGFNAPPIHCRAGPWCCKRGLSLASTGAVLRARRQFAAVVTCRDRFVCPFRSVQRCCFPEAVP
jgi:hypothetical protein